MRDTKMSKLKKFEIFMDNLSSLKEISKDDSNKLDILYMTESSLEVINFDGVKKKYINSLGLSEDNASSVDGILEVGGRVVFIEFKNGKMKNEKRKVKDKIRDSLLMFCDITDSQICDTREQVEFVLVYNKEKNPVHNHAVPEDMQESHSRLEIAKYFSKKANKEFIRFDLEKFKKLYFKDVHTYSEEEFKDYIERYY